MLFSGKGLEVEMKFGNNGLMENNQRIKTRFLSMHIIIFHQKNNILQ